MASTEIRTQVYLPAELHRRLRAAAHRRGVSMAELIRESAGALLDKSEGAGPLDQVVGLVANAPRDLSEGHDKYLYGDKSKQQKSRARR